MIHAICTELINRSSEVGTAKIETIYFGGGTPSLLSKKQLEQIFESIYKHYEVTQNAEVTLECNPDDLNPQLLIDLKQAGVNRLSIGIQSFDGEVLQLMNRAHNAEEALNCIGLAKNAGFDNLTIDLIYGIPGKGMEYWKSQLNKYIELDIPHLSAYCLTVEPKTVFSKWKKTGQIKLPSDEQAHEQFNYMTTRLNEVGYEQYEISNFSKEGFISKHNSAYWLGKMYLGIGPSAHSYNGHQRRWNVANNPQYIKGVNKGSDFFETEELSTTDQFNDYILTRLRTRWGINLEDLNELGKELNLSDFNKALEKHLKQGNLIEKNQLIRLSKQGMFIADHISADLFV